MSFTRDDVVGLARLARLGLTGDEQDLLARQLAGIVAYAHQVADVDTRSAPEAKEPADPLLREDAVAASLDRALTLGSAPAGDPHTGLIKVPRVLG